MIVVHASIMTTTNATIPIPDRKSHPGGLPIKSDISRPDVSG